MDSKIRGVAALPHVAKAYLESQVSMKAIKQLAAVLEED